jgi:PAS domain S-box-containing protein
MHRIAKDRPLTEAEIFKVHLEAPYFQALYKAPVPVIIAREDGRLLLLNRAFEAVTGYTAGELPSIDEWGRLQEVDEAEMRARFASHFNLETPLAPVRITVKTKRGGVLIWELFSAPLGCTTDGQRMVIQIASDVTEKIDHQRHLESLASQLEVEVCKRTEALNATIEALTVEVDERKRMGDALALSRERLKNLSQRTLTILEADRRSISKELHDSLGASLAAIKFSLEEKELKRSRADGRLEESLDQEIGYLLDTIKETKRISANLRPTTLDDLGLVATIEWYLRQFQRMYRDITVEFTTDIADSHVPDAMQIIIYRIVQEGLSNAAKHGRASTVRLRLGDADNGQSISLFIEDDGCGFNVHDAISRKDPLSGYGLTAMRERCEIFGGSFQIDSSAGHGTRIQAVLPV